MQGYTHSGPINCDIDFDSSHLRGKTAIVTGGANGLGKAYVRELANAGVTVCFGDLDVEGGKKLASELQNTHFVQCDTTKWADQVNLFKQAAAHSRNGKIDYVVANAGVARKDDVFEFRDQDEPEEPDLSTIDINLKGALFTVKLSLHYFIKQNGQKPSSEQDDACLVLIGSGAAFLDCPRGPQYQSTKWGVRGVMHSLRRTAFYYGGRVNVISPWYVRTKILSKEAFNTVANSGVQFAETSDASQCLLRILSDHKINGHSFFISGKKWAPRGYVDLDLDDYPGSALLKEIQEDQMKSAPVSARLFL